MQYDQSYSLRQIIGLNMQARPVVAELCEAV